MTDKNLLDRTKLDAVVRPIVRAHGGEVVDIEWKQEPGGWVLRVFVEKAGSAEKNASTEAAAVSLELCSNVARDLSPALDVADLIQNRYHLEVGSPGVERALKTEKDFVRFRGKKAKVKLNAPVDGQKVLVGLLEAAEPGYIAVRDGGKVRVAPWDMVVSAHLVFEYGPAPKPGKAKKDKTDKKGPKTTAPRESSES